MAVAGMEHDHLPLREGFIATNMSSLAGFATFATLGVAPSRRTCSLSGHYGGILVISECDEASERLRCLSKQKRQCENELSMTESESPRAASMGVSVGVVDGRRC